MSAIPSFEVTSWPGGTERTEYCPVCADPRSDPELDHLRDATFAAAGGEWAFRRCRGCRVLYLDPRPDRKSIHFAYRNYYTHFDSTAAGRNPRDWMKQALVNGYRNRVFRSRLRPALSIGALIVPLFRSQARRLRREDRGLGWPQRPGQRLLDVGCGSGGFLRMMAQMGWRCFGIEQDPAAATAARAGGVEVLAAELTDLDKRHDASFDAVTLSHVIEHVHDPVDALKHCRRLLRPGGYLWLETPNIDSAGYEAYGVNWRGLEAPRHLVIFNPAALRRALEGAGFERIAFLPPIDVTLPMSMMSAALSSGQLVGLNPHPTLPEVARSAKRHARQAARLIRRDPYRSEFIDAIAYRPSTVD